MPRIRLQSLTLTGFKSFPDEVELTFPGKMSAIIGPNGCGKSNVVDAILWVLGEQSPSLMRLKQMGDVVFSGASSRPAAGAAEVTLILESDDGHWKETDGRLEVRRRVFRNGPSEYRINGRAVRLKDVFDELAGVGLGTRAYSIIEQGRVGQVLSARPIDRRALLEEAAGITRYKARKHEAELKLEHTRQNLLRLDDVIGEVNRTLRQIKRQAKQAERHQKLETELKEHLRCLFTIDAHRLDGQRTDITRRRAQAQNEVAAAAAALGGSDADLGRAREELEAARRETDAAREEVATLLGSRERLEAFLERSADMLDNLRASLDHAKTESTTLTSARGAVEERIAEANTRHGKLESELESVRSDLERHASRPPRKPHHDSGRISCEPSPPSPAVATGSVISSARGIASPMHSASSIRKGHASSPDARSLGRAFARLPTAAEPRRKPPKKSPHGAGRWPTIGPGSANRQARRSARRSRWVTRCGICATGCRGSSAGLPARRPWPNI